MNAVLEFLADNPSIAYGVGMLLQITVISCIALAIARYATRNPVVRWWTLGLALILILTSPLTIRMAQRAGFAQLKLETIEETAPATVLMDAFPRQLQRPERLLGDEPIEVVDVPIQASATVGLQAASTAVTLPTVEPSASAVSLRLTAEDLARRAIYGLFGIWVVGAVWMLIRVLRGYWMLRCLLNSARTIDDLMMQTHLSHACDRVGLRSLPHLLSSDEVSGPMAAGISRQVIVLPGELSQILDGESIRDVLTHEAAHIARRDPLIVLVQSCVGSLFWIHPLVRVVIREFCGAREDVCDNHVLKNRPAPSYSRTLLKLAEIMSPEVSYPAAVGMLNEWKLEQRVGQLLDDRRNRETGLTRRSVMMVGWAAVVMLAIGVCSSLNITRADEAKPAVVADKQVQVAVEVDDPAVPKPPSTVFEFAGTVVDPDGKPVEGAKIYFSRRDAKPWTRSDAKGKFKFTCKKSNLPNGAQWGRLKFIAVADGYGLAISQGLRFESSGKGMEDLQARNPNKNFDGLKKFKPILKLTPDTIPLKGQIVDLEGQPVAGVTIQTRIVANTYARFAFDSVKTDAEGRFQIRGIGDGRTSRLVAKGDDTAFSILFARTDRKKTETKTSNNSPDPFGDGSREPANQRVIYGSTFTHAVAPSIPVQGIVTDSVTGKPVNGATVYVYALPNNDERDRREEFFCVTDSEGKYRLNGLPVGSSQLFTSPPKESAYLAAGKTITISQNSESVINGDFKMTPGVMVRGKVINVATGKGVQGMVDYSAKEGNKFYGKAKSFQRTSSLYQYKTDENGDFEIPVLPGPGYVTFRVRGEGFPLGVLSPGAKRDLDESGLVYLQSRPVVMLPQNHNTVVKINPKPGQAIQKVDINLSPGAVINVKMVDADGKSVKTTEVEEVIQFNMTARGNTYKLKSDTYRMRYFTPSHPTTLTVRHRGRNLVGYKRFDQPTDGDHTLVLKRAGTIKGRVVNSDGKPRVLTIDGYGRSQKTDEDGRFQLEGVPPDVPITIQGRIKFRVVGQIGKDIKVGVGETLDLGDVEVEKVNQ